MSEGASEYMDERPEPISQELRKTLMEHGWYNYLGRLSPDRHCPQMRDAGVTVYSGSKYTPMVPIETVYGYPIPYIPDKSMVYLEGVGAIYRDGDRIRVETDEIWFC